MRGAANDPSAGAPRSLVLRGHDSLVHARLEDRVRKRNEVPGDADWVGRVGDVTGVEDEQRRVGNRIPGSLCDRRRKDRVVATPEQQRGRGDLVGQAMKVVLGQGEAVPQLCQCAQARSRRVVWIARAREPRSASVWACM